jgi:hypothetical protein
MSNIFLKLFRFKKNKTLKTVFLNEQLDMPKRNTVYVIGEKGFLWFVIMSCPCGCNEILNINLIEGNCPTWSLQEHSNGTISLFPSIWRTTGCRSHFFLKKGKIIWCKNIW